VEQLFPVQVHFPAGGLLQAVYAPDQGAFSRSRRPDNGDFFPFGYMETDIFENMQMAEVFIHPFQTNHGIPLKYE
jgi:hypothetical protein